LRVGGSGARYLRLRRLWDWFFWLRRARFGLLRQFWPRHALAFNQCGIDGGPLLLEESFRRFAARDHRVRMGRRGAGSRTPCGAELKNPNARFRGVLVSSRPRMVQAVAPPSILRLAPVKPASGPCQTPPAPRLLTNGVALQQDKGLENFRKRSLGRIQVDRLTLLMVTRAEVIDVSARGMRTCSKSLSSLRLSVARGVGKS
jgi:hypothetical protein